MVHVGIRLDAHEFIDAHAARLAHPAEIVALQIDEHHVLGALLRMRGELGHLGAHRRPGLRLRGRVPAMGRGLHQSIRDAAPDAPARS